MSEHTEDPAVGIFYDEDGNVNICPPPAVAVISSPNPGESEATS